MLFLEKLIQDFLLPKPLFIVRYHNDGTLENIDTDKDGDTTKVYSNLLKNTLSAGIQFDNQKHDDYKKLNIKPMGSLYPKDFK